LKHVFGLTKETPLTWVTK